MEKILIIGCGGFLGAVARYGLSGLVYRYADGPFPFGTLVVNLLGCLLIGVAMSLVEDRQMFSPNIRLFLMIGLLGAFTTFSTVGYETFALLHDSEWQLALYNVTANVVLGVCAVGLGRAAASLLP